MSDSPKEVPCLVQWRHLADRFPCVYELVEHGHLPKAYCPQEMDWLCNHRQQGLLSLSVRAVLQFLLHVWDYRAFPFELAEVRAWDVADRHAFTDWASGVTTGQPCQYF